MGPDNPNKSAHGIDRLEDALRSIRNLNENGGEAAQI